MCVCACACACTRMHTHMHTRTWARAQAWLELRPLLGVPGPLREPSPELCSWPAGAIAVSGGARRRPRVAAGGAGGS